VPRARKCAAPTWLTLEETTARLGKSPRTVYRWAEWGWLVPHYFGHRVRFDAAEVDRLVAEGTPPTPGRPAR
jgi:excisionase family DNA binding protein